MLRNPLNTYAPVVVRSTVRILLILECILGLNIQSIVFYDAFLQADTSKGKGFYIELPTNFTCGKVKGVLLNFDEIIYGQV